MRIVGKIPRHQLEIFAFFLLGELFDGRYFPTGRG